MDAASKLGLYIVGSKHATVCQSVTKPKRTIQVDSVCWFQSEFQKKVTTVKYIQPIRLPLTVLLLADQRIMISFYGNQF